MALVIDIEDVDIQTGDPTVWGCRNDDCPNTGLNFQRHFSKSDAFECAGWALCLCGCYARWHGIGMASTQCFSPNCGDCREFTPASEAA